MSPSSNTFLLPTGGCSRCWFSLIQAWKLKACRRPFAIALSSRLSRRRRARAFAVELEPAGLERAPRGLALSVGELEHRPPHRAAALAQQLLPVFRMGVEFLRRPRALDRLAHRIEAVAHRLGTRHLAAL